MGEVVFLSVVSVVVGLLVVRAFMPPSPSAVERWAQARDVRLTARSSELVPAYLRRTRRFRTLGGVMGFLVWLLPGIVYDLTPTTWAWRGTLLEETSAGVWWPLVVGYLLGALAAELSIARARYGDFPGRPPGDFPGSPGSRRASLVPRRVDDYLDPFARNGLRVFATLHVLLVPVAAVLPLLPRLQSGPSVTRFGLVAAAAVGIVLVVEWLQRLIVRRPQPFAADDLVTADDAVRGSSVHACAGVGLTLVMTLVADELWMLGASTGFRLLRWTLLLLGLVVFGGGLGIWLGYGTTHARAVRRSPAVGT
ncbi:MAG: hypothetical protein ABR592_08945 [Nitriliruptorales bacterium]